MLDRDKVLGKAVDDCLREMFAKAQPAADLDNINEEYKAGKIDEDKDGPVYDRHYLSMEEFQYILNKYMKAYRVNCEWDEDVEFVEKYLTEGGTKDKYIEGYTDKNGNHHPGYRGYEKVKPLKYYIKKILDEEIVNGEICEDVTDKVVNKVMELISDCKHFYKFNADEQKFRNTVCMTCSPTGNKETVKKWWKDHYDVDIEIEERNPLLLWDMDYYGDNFEEVMEEEDGPNWKEIWDKKWKDEVAKKEAEREERLKKIREDYENFKNIKS